MAELKHPLWSHDCWSTLVTVRELEGPGFHAVESAPCLDHQPLYLISVREKEFYLTKKKNIYENILSKDENI